MDVRPDNAVQNGSTRLNYSVTRRSHEQEQAPSRNQNPAEPAETMTSMRVFFISNQVPQSLVFRLAFSSPRVRSANFQVPDLQFATAEALGTAFETHVRIPQFRNAPFCQDQSSSTPVSLRLGHRSRSRELLQLGYMSVGNNPEFQLIVPRSPLLAPSGSGLQVCYLNPR